MDRFKINVLTRKQPIQVYFAPLQIPAVDRSEKTEKMKRK